MPKPRALPVLAATLLSVLLSACAFFDVYTDNPPPDYRGTWTGTLRDSVGGEGALQLEVLSQYKGPDYYATGDTLGGSWSVTFATGPNSGILEGQVLGSGFEVLLRSASSPDCTYRVSGGREGDAVSGTYTAEGCGTYVVGTLELSKTP